MSEQVLQRWRCPEKGTITLLHNLCQIRKDTAARLNRIAHPKPDDIKTMEFCLTCERALLPYDILPSPSLLAACESPSARSAAGGQTFDAPQPCAAESTGGDKAVIASVAQGPLTAPQPGESEPAGLPLGSDAPGPLPQEPAMPAQPETPRAETQGLPLCSQPECHAAAMGLMQEALDAALDALGLPIRESARA